MGEESIVRVVHAPGLITIEPKRIQFRCQATSQVDSLAYVATQSCELYTATHATGSPIGIQTTD